MHLVVEQQIVDITLAEIKEQVNLNALNHEEENTYFDNKLHLLLLSETESIAKYLNRILPPTTLTIRVKPSYKQIIQIPTPANNIKSIKAYQNDQETTIPNDNYFIYQYDTPHLLMPKSHSSWPIADYIIITLECGYTTLPPVFKQAILIRICDKFENRTEQVRGKMNNVYEMLFPYRIVNHPV